MFKRVWPVLLLLCVSISIAYLNVQKGTWLVGWDSTQPELNFPLNLSRGLSAVWQEYRGLGITDGMAHSANLMHLMYAWILANIVGVSYVRYAFTLLAHLAGGVGMYMLLRYVGRAIRGDRVSRWIALAGALFYMLNPYTLQMFYQPLEVFVTHFAALPWLTYTLIQYVSNPSKRSLGGFALVNILTLPQAHVPTLFIVWMMLATCLLLPALLLRMRRYGKQILVVFVVLVGIHGYWGLPYIYTALNNAQSIGEAKINVLSNPEIVLRNDAYGDITSVVKMQGFGLAFEDWNPGYKYDLQMPQWEEWWGQKWVMWVMGGLSVLAGVGIVVTLVERQWWMGGVVLMYTLALGNLGARIAYIREIGAFLREHVPYYEAIFRFTFTKFALIYVFVFTILMGLGILGLYRLMRGWISKALMLGVIGIVVVVAWPVWQGQFFYHNLKLKVPSEYQSIFKFFDANREGRVLPLPYPDFWGWQSNEWGYRGSGFVWQGITNPTLYGSFNAWSPYNEGFYDEFSTALYGESGKCDSDKVTQCHEQIQQVLQKYDVRYVLLDESVIAPGQDKEILRIEETKKIAEILGWSVVFHDGFLTVWDTGHTAGDQYVSAPGKFSWVAADTSKVREDVVYEQLGTYVEGRGEGGVAYPFAQLMREEAKGVTYDEQGITLSSLPVAIATGSHLEVPGWGEGEAVEVQYLAKLENGKLQIVWEPAYLINGIAGPKLATVEIPTMLEYAWVKVGEGEAVFVELGKEVRGRAILAVGEKFDIRLYDGVVDHEESPEGWQDRWRQICGEHKELDCYAMRLSAPTTESLLQTVSPYEGAGLEVCLDLEGEPYGCANVGRRGVSPIVNTLAVQKGERYWLDYVVERGGATPDSPSVRWYTLYDQWTMNNDQWEDYQEPERFELQDKRIQVTVPGTPRIYDMSVLGKSKITNCDVLNRGTAEKVEREYIANARGAACDYSELAGLSTDLSYLMRLSGENEQGRSVKVFLFNQGSKRNDLEYLLGKGRFDQSFALIPSPWASLYTLNTETRSFGERAENTLYPVELRYLPLLQIAGARVGSAAGAVSTLKIGEVKKTGTWLYRVRVEGEGLLKLSQGFDRGWVGVRWPMGDGQWTMGDGQWGMEHVKVDGWANGWIVNNGLVVLFYWPQLLEYLGFGLLGVTILVIIKSRE